jgi:molecular chaperone HscB
MADYCPRCGAKLETPLGCNACGVLFSPESAPTPFEALGMEPVYRVDEADLKRRLLRLSRILHPDYFGSGDPAQRRLAEQGSAELNRAFAILADDWRRADWIVGWLGGPDEARERAMPQAFLAEVLEWNEALEAARSGAPGGEERRALDALEGELRAQRETAFGELASLLEPLPSRGDPALARARRQLNALRYLDRTLSEIEALRLEEATSRP